MSEDSNDDSDGEEGRIDFSDVLDFTAQPSQQEAARDALLDLPDAVDPTQPFTTFIPAPWLADAPELLKVEVNGQILQRLAREILLLALRSRVELDADYAAHVMKGYGTTDWAGTREALLADADFQQMERKTCVLFTYHLSGIGSDMIGILTGYSAGFALARDLDSAERGDFRQSMFEGLLGSVFAQLEERVAGLRGEVKRILGAQ